MSYLSGVYLESWFSRLRRGVLKTLKRRRKHTEEKHWKMKRKKNEEYRESQVTTINNKNKNWFYFLYKSLYFAQKHSLKKVVHTITFIATGLEPRTT